eukprot:TRINITY_DN8658_c0_g2_i2.p1 TRINITY_DN8658_c0_g2~~TRINITY_DN8658_c0_g2_i2.p1  ORF type:complete len:381 (-),score=68.12 TRINITY_DN8658_c0_g2_i2:54-1196(-)
MGKRIKLTQADVQKQFNYADLIRANEVITYQATSNYNHNLSRNPHLSAPNLGMSLQPPSFEGDGSFQQASLLQPNAPHTTQTASSLLSNANATSANPNTPRLNLGPQMPSTQVGLNPQGNLQKAQLSLNSAPGPAPMNTGLQLKNILAQGASHNSSLNFAALPVSLTSSSAANPPTSASTASSAPTLAQTLTSTASMSTASAGSASSATTGPISLSAPSVPVLSTASMAPTGFVSGFNSGSNATSGPSSSATMGPQLLRLTPTANSGNTMGMSTPNITLFPPQGVAPSTSTNPTTTMASLGSASFQGAANPLGQSLSFSQISASRPISTVTSATAQLPTLIPAPVSLNPPQRATQEPANLASLPTSLFGSVPAPPSNTPR